MSITIQHIEDRTEQINRTIVTALSMHDIEHRLFAAGMPITALMEKVGNLLTQRIVALYKHSDFPRVGVLVGPGHNGGDALVVARELHFQGYEVLIYQPLAKSKELTGQHAAYIESLGIPVSQSIEKLKSCNFLIDGLFGFGLERSLQGEIAAAIDTVNAWGKPIVSIDLPSGIHTDTGAVLGKAIRAKQTFCLGLWKQGLLQDCALEFTGLTTLIDFDIPWADITAILGNSPTVQRITPTSAIAHLPLPRPLVTHKYKMGHLLLICGSQKYSGGAILTTLGAQASGVGMLSVAVPKSLQPLLTAQSPESLIIGCPETENGAIANLPTSINLEDFDAIACGPGLTTKAESVVIQILHSKIPLILDADALNILATQKLVATLRQRQATTILTPHVGEFKRLFPHLTEQIDDRINIVRLAAQESQSIVVLKGAITVIASPEGLVWLNPDSTPALARGGSGDVLTGLLGGLVAQAILNKGTPIESIVPTAVWWHAQAGIYAAGLRTELGVDALTLARSLIPSLSAHL